MRQYQSYKDSGVEWIPPIPSHWEVYPTKHYFRNAKRIVGSDADCYERLALTLNGVIKRSKEDNEGLQPERFEDYQILKEHELVFKLIDLENIKTSRVGLSPYEGLVSPAYIVLTNTSTDNRFFYYWFMYLYYNQIFNQLGSEGVRRSLTAKDVLRLPIACPPPEERVLIADYLDRKMEALDNLIVAKQDYANLLSEAKIELITTTVTRGVVRDATTKHSGIEWLGEVPSHWQILTNHQLFAERNIKCDEPDAVLLSVTKHLGVILQSQAEEMNLATVAPADTTEGYKVVRKGDLVMNIMRAKDGSYGISDYDGVISPAYCIYYTRQEANPQYLYYLFKTPMYMEIFKNYSTGIAEHRMRLYPVNFFKIPAVVPPLDEQNEIVVYLDKRVKDIDELIALTQQQIEKLKEYRQSIISEVVTGKVAVE